MELKKPCQYIWGMITKWFLAVSFPVSTPVQANTWVGGIGAGAYWYSKHVSKVNLSRI